MRKKNKINGGNVKFPEWGNNLLIAMLMLLVFSLVIFNYYKINTEKEENGEVYLSGFSGCNNCIGFLPPLVRVYKPHNPASTTFADNMANINNIENYFSDPEITLLKNEGESFQIAVKNSGVHDFSLDYKIYFNNIETNDLEIEMYKEEFANVTYYLYKTAGDRSPIGYYTDPLISYDKNENVNSNENLIWWITIRSKDTSKTGDYKIKFNVTRDNEEEEIEVNVSVLNYALPKKPNFKAIFDLDYNHAKPEGYKPLDYHHALSTEEKNEVVSNYFSYMERNKINTGTPYYDAACLDCAYIYYNSVAPMLPITALDLIGNSITVDFTSFDNSMQKYITNGHMNAYIISTTSWGFYRLYIPSFYGDNFLTQDNDAEEYSKFYNLYWTSVISHLEQKGWLDYAYIAIDEPFIPQRNGTYIKYDNNFTSLVRAINPEKPKGIVWLDQYAVNFQDNLTDMLHIDSYNTIDYTDNNNPLEILYSKMNSVKGEDDEMGTYWTSNAHIHLDRPVIDNRIWGVKYWKYNITSLYHWDVLMFTYMNAEGVLTNDNPWKSISHRWGAGGSTLFYPPCKNGKCLSYNSEIIPSIRSEMYRDSVEDYDYLTVLSTLIETAEDSGLNVGSEKNALNNMVSLDYDLKSWNRDNSAFIFSRRDVALAIPSLYNKLYCGNDNVDEGEDCDDGNTASGDGCSLLCESEGSGDTGGTSGGGGDSGGGGGGGSSSEGDDLNTTDGSDSSENKFSCKENWKCGKYGSCIDGIKTKECIDLNRCGTEIKKPDQIRTCIADEDEENNRVFSIVISILVSLIIVSGIIVQLLIREKKKKLNLININGNKDNKFEGN